jgi:general stress protein YciG
MRHGREEAGKQAVNQTRAVARKARRTALGRTTARPVLSHGWATFSAFSKPAWPASRSPHPLIYRKCRVFFMLRATCGTKNMMLARNLGPSVASIPLLVFKRASTSTLNNHHVSIPTTGNDSKENSMATKQGNEQGNVQGSENGSEQGKSAGSSQKGSGKRGFAAMSEAQQREIASKGGQAAHQKGTAHEFDSEEARRAGQKGGEAVSRNREHMAEIGRKGGESRQSANRDSDSLSGKAAQKSSRQGGKDEDES